MNNPYGYREWLKQVEELLEQDPYDYLGVNWYELWRAGKSPQSAAEIARKEQN